MSREGNIVLDMLEKMDWSPLFISVKTAAFATVIAFFIGIFTAAKVMKVNPKIKAVIDGILTMPMVLPPTVMGYVLLLLFSLRRPFGAFLYDNYNIKVVQTWSGCVIAAVIVSFPLMYRSTRGAFEQIEMNIIYAAQTLGMSNRKIFWKIIIPSAKPGILSGTILTFARALGEYGATSMLAGNISGKTSTISQVIAMVMKDGDYLKAGIWVVIIMIFAFCIISVMNILPEKKNAVQKRWK